MVEDEIKDDMQVPLMGFLQQMIKISQRAVLWVDVKIISNIVPEIFIRRWINRGEPERIYAQVGQIV